MSIRHDVDNSGSLADSDVILTLKKSIGVDLSSTQWINSSITGDVNCDGSVDSIDAELILRKSLNLDMSSTDWCEGVDDDRTIYIIGDSTVRRHNVSWDSLTCGSDNPEDTLQGWGDSLHIYMKHPEKQVNRARQGASAEEYLDGPPGTTVDEVFREFASSPTPLTRYWSPTKQAITDDIGNPFLLIQFGSSNEYRYYSTKCDGDPRGLELCREEDFKAAVKYYIDEAKNLGAIPVLVTPPVGRYKDSEGNQLDGRGPFPGYVRDLAVSENVELIDLHAKSLEEFAKYSDEKLQEVFGNCVHDSTGAIDRTHFEPHGADIVAGWVKELACELNDARLCEQFSTSVDKVIPTISLIGDKIITVQAGDSFTDPGATAHDDVDGDITSNIVVAGSVDINNSGTYELKYNVSDSSGNSAIELTRTVIVQGGSNESVFMYEDAEDADTKDWTVYSGNVGTVENIFDNSKNSRVIKLSGPNGTTDGFRYREANPWFDSDRKVISWDLNFNDDYVFYVSVKTSDGDKIVYYEPTDDGDAITYGGARYKFSLGSSTKDGLWHTITRDLEGDIHSLDPNNDLLQVYRIAVRGSGMLDNIKLMSTQTSADDSVNPVVTLNGESIVTVSVGGSFTDPGATAHDDVDGDITSSIEVYNPVDTSIEGDYEVLYTVHDSTGNGAYAKRVVQVRDNFNMIEDAEDGNTTGWDTYADNSGATISNVDDSLKNSKVLEFSGNGLDTGFRYDLSTYETNNFVVSWRLRYSEPFKFLVKVKTTNYNPLYIEYTPDDNDLGFYTANGYNYVHNALGSGFLSTDKWESFTRDLGADLHRFLPNEQLEEIQGFRVKGSGRIDDISISSRGNISEFVFGGSKYKIVKTADSWQDAYDDAVSESGYLANIGNKVENDEIYARLYRYISTSEYSNSVASDGGGATYVWIGGYDSDNEGEWLWKNTMMSFWSGDMTGSPVNSMFYNWGVGSDDNQHEPDNYNNQDSLAIALTEWSVSNGDLGQTSQWNDLSSSDELYYIIEHEL